MSETAKAPPTCATCRHFRAGAAMLDPRSGQRVATGECTRKVGGVPAGFRLARESCWQHAPREAAPPPEPKAA